MAGKSGSPQEALLMTRIRKGILGGVVLLAIVILGIFIALKNTGDLEFNFLIFTVTSSAANVVIGTFIVGVLLGVLSGIYLGIYLHITHNWAEGKARKLEDELHKRRSGNNGK